MEKEIMLAGFLFTLMLEFVEINQSTHLLVSSNISLFSMKNKLTALEGSFLSKFTLCPPEKFNTPIIHSERKRKKVFFSCEKEKTTSLSYFAVT